MALLKSLGALGAGAIPLIPVDSYTIYDDFRVTPRQELFLLSRLVRER
jgi:hypothetical protein